MNSSGVTPGADDYYSALPLMDGTDSQSSYAVVARRGDIFLGIQLSGLIDGLILGLPGKTYLSARVWSARNQELAEQLDAQNSAINVVGLFQQLLALDGAWPNFSFDKLDGQRASLGIGLFIQGSLLHQPVAVLSQLEKPDLVRKLVDYVIDKVGPEHRIARAKAAAAWLFTKIKPTLDHLREIIKHGQIAEQTKKEFKATVEHALEVVAPYPQQLKAIYQKHMQADANAGVE